MWWLWASSQPPRQCTPRHKRGAPAACQAIVLSGLVGASASAGEGRIAFAQPIHDFGRAKSGDAVKHTFVFTNAGSGPLEITNVQTSCGCATAGDWTRRVEPGKTGSIPVQFNTAGFGGEVLKTIAVYSTDRTNFLSMLQLKGTVWKPVEVVPSFAVLNILPDATAAGTTVRITNNIDEHISILSAPKCSSPAFAAEIRTNHPGKEFQLDIKALPPFKPGNTQGSVTLTTSSTNLPLLTVGVWAIVQPRISVIPAQVTLPPPPLATRLVATVTVQNNTTNLVTIFDPAMNQKNVELTLQEVMPGRAYVISLAFPAGFELPANTPCELSFKSSLADLPLFTVPISHLAKPPAQPVATANTSSK